MKKFCLYFIATLLLFVSSTPLVGCFIFDDTPTDYNADAVVVAPENVDLEHFVAQDGVTYYTSKGLSLWAEVKGEFLKIDYFYLDGNKRVYDNLYFYQEDYFYMDVENSWDVFASLKEGDFSEFVQEEKEQGYDIQINVKKTGKYKLIFDVDTLKFDVVFKEEIQTPVYYTIKNCSIYSVKTNWVEMNVNPSNQNEFVINDFNLNANDFICFFNNLHTSCYKVTLDENINNKLASLYKKNVTVNVGGKYNIYINRKTYVVRLELTNPDTADYSCVYYDGNQYITLSPYEIDVPYVFRYTIFVDTNYTTSLPRFHTAHYKTYSLSVVDTDNLLIDGGDSYNFKKIGRYELIINLKSFKITPVLLPE